MIIYPKGVPALRCRDFYRLNISENVLFLAVFDEDSGNSRSYAAKQFVAYRSDEVGCMVDRGAAESFVRVDRYLVAYLRFRDIRDVHKCLIHADTSTDRSRLAVNQYIPLTGEPAVEAVCISAGDKREPGLVICLERPAVAYRVAGLDSLYLADYRLHAEYGLDSVRERVFGVRAVSVHHYACADKVAVEILVEQYAAAVLGMHGKLPCMADVRELFVLFLGELHIFLFEGVRN